MTDTSPSRVCGVKGNELVELTCLALRSLCFALVVILWLDLLDWFCIRVSSDWIPVVQRAASRTSGCICFFHRKWWVHCLSKRWEIIWCIQCCRNTWRTSEVFGGGWLQSPHECRPPPSWRTNGGLWRALQGSCCSTSADEKSWPLGVIKPMIHLANAAANKGGYSAVYRLRYAPDSVRTPAICWCDWEPWGQIHAREETSSHVVQNIQLFAQSRSKWQAATTVQ